MPKNTATNMTAKTPITRTEDDNPMKTMFPALAVLLMLGACGTETPAPEPHEGGGIVVTHYTPLTELFVEYRPLVLDRRRRFDAHLSWTADYRPVTEGRLIAELVWPGGQVDRAEAEVSDTPGIFRPLLTATRAGQARLRLRLQSGGRESVHDLGVVTVYPTSEAGAAAAPPHEENPDRIAFPKEVQWRIPFRAVAATRGAMDQTLPVTVDVRLAPDAETIVAAPVAGVIRTGGSVPASGMQVRAGQQLASISARLGGGEDVASLDLGIAEARIQLDGARREVARMNSLVRSEAAPQRRLDEARTAERLAAAQLSAAQRRRSALGGGGPGVPLVAPISGRILHSTLVRGGSVEAGEELIRIGNPSSLWLVAHVPEAQAAMIGQPGGIDVTANGRPVDLSGGNLRLVQGGGYVDPATRTAEVIFAVNGTNLRPGQRVQGMLATGRTADTISVPVTAIVNEGGQDVVYVQVEGEAFERRPVQVTMRSGGRAAITGAIRPGERVVSEGTNAVRAAAATPDAFGHGHAH